MHSRNEPLANAVRRNKFYKVDVDVVSGDFVWYSQVALIVVAHVMAVYLAHGIALHLLHRTTGRRYNQYPMLTLTVLHTILSLWILNQPMARRPR